MKTKSTLFLALLFAGSVSRATVCDDLVAQGRAALAAHNLTNANLYFSNAVAQCPGHENANVFYSATRLLVLPGGSPIDTLLTRLGVSQTNRDLYNFSPTIATNGAGKWIVPANVNAAEAPALARTNILPQLTSAAANLAAVDGHRGWRTQPPTIS